MCPVETAGKYYICHFKDQSKQRLFRKYSDNTIIEGIRQQDEKILSWIYSDYFQSVRHHVLKNSGSEADVSDVFQEAVITLYKQITDGSLDLTSDLKGYFFGIARNMWNAQLRRRKRIVDLETDLPDDDNNDDDEQILEKIVSRVFQRLKPDAQKILRFFSEGYSYEEIAERMNLKNETYARRKKYLSKEILIGLIKEDPEYKDYLGLK
jgi:RNA polymerase sigma factor (sigma-70 family)